MQHIDAGGGRRIAVTVGGEGEPLVLLEVGLGAESSSWQTVADGVARFTRVCFYDRAGRGASDPPARAPRQPGDLVQDARSVVAALAPAQPVVLVGQSLGGLIARLYAHRHPRDVAALVLVDSLHEDQFDICGPKFPPHRADEPAMLTGMRAFWTGGWRDPANNAEHIDLPACRRAAHEIASLGDRPLRVITASGFTHGAHPFGGAGEDLQASWHGLQSKLAALSSRSTHEVLADSGHFIQNDRPDAIVDAIRAVVDQLR